MKKIVIITLMVVFMAVYTYADDVFIDGDGNITTGTSNNVGNLKVTGASGEHGLVGEASGTGAAGVYGKSGPEVNDDYGTLGEFDGLKYYGVHGKSTGGLAGYFEGHAEVTGDLSVGGTITGETDPTVNASVKDGVDWTELTGIPTDFADGVDNTGGSDIWTQSGSDIYYNTGNVGIGTISPTGKLDVNGDICLGGVCRTTWPAGSGTGAFTDTGTTAYYNGGNVGIGTTSPASLGNTDSRVLHILQPVATLDNAAAGLRLEVDSIVEGGITSAYNKVSLDGGLFVGTLSNHRVGFIANSMEKMSLTPAGNLGIGTISPLQSLHVQGSSYISDKLGVGIASPTHDLEVSGSSALLSSDTGNFRLAISKNLDTDFASIMFQNNFTGHAEIGLTSDNHFHIKVSADGTTFSDAVVVDNASGNLGIGTMNTDNKVNIISDSTSAIWAESTDTSTLPVIDARNFGSGHAVRIGHFGATGIGLLIAHGSSDPALSIRGASELFTVESNGNVGVGTATPQSSLQVNGYTQLALTSGVPPAADCDAAEERGRMKIDNVNGLLYICVDSGWVAK